MPKPIPYECRVKIIRDRQAGKTYGTIAQEMGYSLSGVKKICHQYKAQGQAGLALNYHRCGRKSPFDPSIYQLIDSIKDGDQGAPYVRCVLQHQHPDLAIPHERTIQRWWKAKGVNRPKIVRQRKARDWTKEVHHTWQIDGKEQIDLASGQQVSWMNIADEASSSVLGTAVFPPVDNDQNSSEAGRKLSERSFSDLGTPQAHQTG